MLVTDVDFMRNLVHILPRVLPLAWFLAFLELTMVHFGVKVNTSSP